MTSLPEDIKLSFIKYFKEKFNDPIKVTGFNYVSGGCINKTGKIDSDKGLFFIKWNSTWRYPGMFEREKEGLELLIDTKSIRIPTPYLTGNANSESFLVMEWIESGMRKEGYWQEFGEQLARMHDATQPYFGLEEDNYIGALPQKNNKEKQWIDFFIQHRLNFQLKTAIDQGRLNEKDLSKAESLFKELKNIFPTDIKPSLLHGDLWSGNIMTGPKGQPCLMDPAAHYGNRESDLAFTKLFGSLPEEFYKAYSEIHPIEKGFEERFDILNLYPLLVHVNLFGGGYISGVRSILKRFG